MTFRLSLIAALICFGTLFAADSGPQLRPWTNYQTIMWVSDSAYKKPEKTPLFFERLEEMGINTAMVHGDGDLKPLLDNHFPYYVENMVNRGLCLKFSSKVTDWDKFVAAWARDGRPETSLVRDYCLDDPSWLGWATKEMQSLVRKNVANHPIAYNIRDELSTTYSANPFDYDFNPIALTGFRDWLKTVYKNLDALNAEWDTKFASWDEVRPFTTDQIKSRMVSGEAMPQGKPDWHALQELDFAEADRRPVAWNFAPWADFRTYMDISLARTLDKLRTSAHQIDPATPVGIEGTQMPSAFGGYDLWRLSQALDWVEPYDIGNAREILGSFMPGKPFMTTVFENKTQEASRRLWHLLLEGDRGCIIWWSEDCIDWSSPDYALTPKAKALMPVLKEMTSPLAKVFIGAERERDPIAIHYSQASIQADWLIESTVDGSTWLRRFSSHEAEHNRHAKIRNGWLKALQDAGYRPQFVSSQQIESGELALRDFKAIVLPDSLALSDREIDKIDEFKNRGSAVLASGSVGLFDQHGKLVPNRKLPNWAKPSFTNDIAAYSAERLKRKPPNELATVISEFLTNLPKPAAFTPDARVLVHKFKKSSAQLYAFEMNINYQMSEDLKQIGGNAVYEIPFDTQLTFPAATHLYNLRTGEYLGRTNSVNLLIDPWRPTLIAALPEKVGDANLIERLLSK